MDHYWGSGRIQYSWGPVNMPLYIDILGYTTCRAMALIFYIIHDIITYKYIIYFAWELIWEGDMFLPWKSDKKLWFFFKTLTIEDDSCLFYYINRSLNYNIIMLTLGVVVFLLLLSELLYLSLCYYLFNRNNHRHCNTLGIWGGKGIFIKYIPYYIHRSLTIKTGSIFSHKLFNSIRNILIIFQKKKKNDSICK